MNWTKARLGEIGKFYSGLSGKTAADFGSGRPFISYNSVFGSSRCFIAGQPLVRLEEGERQNTVSNGDIILTGSSEIAEEVAMSSLYCDQAPAYLNSFCIGFSYDHQRLMPCYAEYFFRGQEFRRSVFPLAQGSTRFNISREELTKVAITLPPLPEQRKIAEILRTWDEAIETAEAELKAKREYKRWLMSRVMGNFSDKKSVSQFGTLKKGGAILREKLRPEGVPVVLYGDIYTKYGEIVTRLASRVDASAVVDGVKLNSGDIVFAGSGETAEEIGKCIAYVGEEAAFAGGDVVILSNHGQDPKYLGYALNSEDAIRQKMRLGQGSSVMHLYKDDVASIKIPLPPISEQRKFGEILYGADTDIELINQRINSLRVQKRGLMQKLLTGEVRVAT